MSMKKKNLFSFLFAMIFLSSCEEIIDIDLNDANAKLVVDGWIYNTPGPYRVRLTLTTNYFDTVAAPKVENALVIVSENDTLLDTLTMGNPGVYRTQKILQGKIGATYTLKVIYEGSVYEAVSTLKPVAPIDTLTYEYKEDTRRDGSGYFVSIYFQEPATPADYYRWVFYKNDKVFKERDELYASDEFYNGNYIAFEFDNHGVDLNDTVRVEMYSLDKTGYEFFRALDEVDNSGNLFDTPPGNAKGNLSNGAIGYFGASSKSSKEIIIE
jgi:hypothetical protein